MYNFLKHISNLKLLPILFLFQTTFKNVNGKINPKARLYFHFPDGTHRWFEHCKEDRCLEEEKNPDSFTNVNVQGAVKVCGTGLWVLHEQDNLKSASNGRDTHIFYSVEETCATADYLGRIKSIEKGLPRLSGPYWNPFKWEGYVYSHYTEKNFGGIHLTSPGQLKSKTYIEHHSMLIVGPRRIGHKMEFLDRSGKNYIDWVCLVTPASTTADTLCVVDDYIEYTWNLKALDLYMWTALEGSQIRSNTDLCTGKDGYQNHYIPEWSCFPKDAGLIELPHRYIPPPTTLPPPTTTTTTTEEPTTEEITEPPTTMEPEKPTTTTTTTPKPTTTTTTEPTTLPPCPPPPPKDFTDEEKEILSIRTGGGGKGGKSGGKKGPKVLEGAKNKSEPKYYWMFELFERSASILNLICGPPILHPLFLKMFVANFYSHHLKNLDKIKDLVIPEAELMEIYYDLARCRTIVESGKYAEITNNTIMQLATYKKITELTDIMSSKITIREDLDYVMELSWLMSNLVGQVCSDARDFQANIILRYFLVYDKLYFQPLKEQWQDPTQNNDFYKYAFGGLGMKKSLIKLATCVYNSLAYVQSPLYYTRVIENDIVK